MLMKKCPAIISRSQSLIHFIPTGIKTNSYLLAYVVCVDTPVHQYTQYTTNTPTKTAQLNKEIISPPHDITALEQCGWVSLVTYQRKGERGKLN